MEVKIAHNEKLPGKQILVFFFLRHSCIPPFIRLLIIGPAVMAVLSEARPGRLDRPDLHMPP